MAEQALDKQRPIHSAVKTKRIKWREPENPIRWAFAKELREHDKFQDYQIVGCPNGYLFNLGNDYDIELVFLPGHAPGHAAYLDKKNRILFAGDDACFGAIFIPGPEPSDPYGKYATVSGFRNELVKLVARMDEFDGIFPGHGLVDMGSIMLVNILEACEKVIADPENCDSKMIYESGYLSYGLSGV